jgi:hypothetical protein
MRINKVIRSHGETTLIEVVIPARGAVQVYVPSDALRGEHIDEFDVSGGIEKGVPWEDVLEQILPADKAAELAKLLRDSHIYTVHDVHSNLQVVAALVQRLWQADASRILLLALQYEKGALK